MNVFVWAGILGMESMDWLAVNHFYDGKKKTCRLSIGPTYWVGHRFNILKSLKKSCGF